MKYENNAKKTYTNPSAIHYTQGDKLIKEELDTFISSISQHVMDSTVNKSFKHQMTEIKNEMNHTVNDNHQELLHKLKLFMLISGCLLTGILGAVLYILFIMI